MTEVTGKLWFTCNDYYTVDELGLPAPDKYRDGLHDFKLIQYCCKIMKKFDSEYDTRIELDTSVYPELFDEKLPVRLKLVTTAGEYDDEREIEIKKCPWCDCLATVQTLASIKRIKRCKEKIIPESREQICTIEEVKEMLN